MSTIVSEIYKIFKLKSVNKEASKVIEFIDLKAEQKVRERNEVLATKEDLANVKVDILRWVFGFFVVLCLQLLGFILRNKYNFRYDCNRI